MAGPGDGGQRRGEAGRRASQSRPRPGTPSRPWPPNRPTGPASPPRPALGASRYPPAVPKRAWRVTHGAAMPRWTTAPWSRPVRVGDLGCFGWGVGAVTVFLNKREESAGMVSFPPPVPSLYGRVGRFFSLSTQRINRPTACTYLRYLLLDLYYLYVQGGVSPIVRGSEGGRFTDSSRI